jgi:hypothetical protein
VQGGTMHNKVVTMVERALRESGLDTVRFNFRGTGNSPGSTTTATAKATIWLPWSPGCDACVPTMHCGWPASRSAAT